MSSLEESRSHFQLRIKQIGCEKSIAFIAPVLIFDIMMPYNNFNLFMSFEWLMGEIWNGKGFFVALTEYDLRWKPKIWKGISLI